MIKTAERKAALAELIGDIPMVRLKHQVYKTDIGTYRVRSEKEHILNYERVYPKYTRVKIKGKGDDFYINAYRADYNHELSA